MMSRQLMKQRELFEWLHSLDLSHYFEPFLQNGYDDLEICSRIGESDLEVIGVQGVHEKIELLQAIRHLRLSQPQEPIRSNSSALEPITTTNGNYLEFSQNQSHFGQNCENDVAYCLQKRYLSSHRIELNEDSGDYQDIDDCDCGPFPREPFYESLSPRRHVSTTHRQDFDVRRINRGSRGGTPVRKFHPLQESSIEIESSSTRTRLRENHSIRHERTLPSLGPLSTGFLNELTQESRGCRGIGVAQTHLYGSPLPTTSTRKVDSEDLDSSSGIEPDLVSRKCYALGTRTTSTSTNTPSNSSTPEGGPSTTIEENLREIWREAEQRQKSIGGGGWYRGPAASPGVDGRSKKKKSRATSQVTSNYCLDVLQLLPSTHVNVSTRINQSTPSPKSNTLSRRQNTNSSVVPTVSGLLSSIETSQFHCPVATTGFNVGNGTIKKSNFENSTNMASNLNSREFNYEETNNTYEDIFKVTPGNYKTPSHQSYPHHQYLQHVIISNSYLGLRNQPIGYGSESSVVGPTKSPTKTTQQIYTPGIYSPSSCLLDRDDIYDYAPPIQRNRYNSSPVKRCSPLKGKGKGKSKSSLSCVSVSGVEGGSVSPQKDPLLYATVRGNRYSGRVMSPLHRSASLHTNHSSPTYVNVRSSSRSRNGNQGGGGVEGGGGNGPKLLSSPSSPSSPGSNGCRTLANLSKLTRRLFRTLRIHGHQQHPLPKPRLRSTNQKKEFSQTDWETQSPSHMFTTIDVIENPDSGNSMCMTTLSSLPSNERIIETINRLKYEELQKRKERIAQEHKMILKELKNSMSMSSVSTSTSQQGKNNTSDHPNPSSTSTSVFYVSATVESPTDEELIHNQSILDKNTTSGDSTAGPPLNSSTNRKSEDSSAVTTTGSLALSSQLSLEQVPNSSQPRTSGGSPSPMGGNHSSLGNGDRLGTGVWRGRESGSSRESWNEKSSSSRTSSSSNYHSESPFENSHEQEQTEVGSVRLSPGKSPRKTRFNLSSSNQMKAARSERKIEKGPAEDSLEIVEDVLPLPSSSGGSAGTSPAKALLTKVKELGSRNHKKFRRFSFTTKNSQSDHSDTRRGSDVSASPARTATTAAIDIIGPPSVRNSSEEEELSSLSNRKGSLSLSETEEYNGPFVGKAIALVDCISSPYDLHALSYKKGDIIEIIEKKPTGSWKGKLNNKVGSFKFINVQVIPDEVEYDEECREDGTPLLTCSMTNVDYPSFSSSTSTNGRRRNKSTSPLTPWEMETRQTVANVINGIRKENAALLQNRKDSRHEQHSKSLDSESPFHHDSHHPPSYQKKSKSGGRKSSSTSLRTGRPRSVGDLLRRINLDAHISVFILHGFESLDLFKELEEEDLDRLAILKDADRRKILTAVELLREYDASGEIPPIIIPTYSCPSEINLLDEVEDHLNQILEPPPNFTRGGSSGTTVVRDSGVFLKCDKEEEDPEVEEIILSPTNLPLTNLNPSDKFLMSNRLHKNTKQLNSGSKPNNQSPGVSTTDTTNMTQFSNLEEHYGEVRQRFLHAKSLFEKSLGGGDGQSITVTTKPPPLEYKNQFLYCEKSSDSGISVGANSPPPNTFE